MTESAIINGSPLIFLSRSGHLDLLKAFADTVWVPESVTKEILALGTDDISAQAIQQTPWLITKPPIPFRSVSWNGV